MLVTPMVSAGYIITVCKVVQNCCKGDSPCQCYTPIFRPSVIENPWTDRHQPPLPIPFAPVENAPFDRFSCFMAQKTCFGDILVLFGVRTKIIFSLFFAKKTLNSLFPQCKTSIGKNAGSIKDRVVKFAHSRGFSATADRMAWPPSLSRDRKWSRPPIRRKTTLWMRVTPAA